MWETCLTNKIEGDGYLLPKILFIGEAPGKEEDEIGIPFVGEAGQLLRRYLEKYEFPYEAYYITNTVLCRPPNNRTPKAQEIKACSTFLFDKIFAMKPSIIVPLGNVALKAILNEEGIRSKRGKEINSEVYGCIILPMLHPAAILRNPHDEKYMDEDFRKLKDLLDVAVPREKPLFRDFADIEIVRDVTKLPSLRKKILRTGIIFWDVETNGEDVYLVDKLEVTSISICYSRRKVTVIPFFILNSREKKVVISFMKEILENPSIKKCAQNMNFDSKVMLLKYGIQTINWWHDTMLSHYLINPTPGTHNLTAQTWEFLPDEAGGYDTFVKKAGGAHNIPPNSPELWFYNGMDSAVGFELMCIYEPILKERGQWKIFREILMEVSDDLMNMEIEGMLFDIDYIKYISDKYKTRMLELQVEMDSDEGVKTYELIFAKKFNPKSPPALRWLLFQFYKLEPIGAPTPSGLTSTRKEIIAQYAQMGNKFCELLTEFRRLSKADSTYLAGCLEKLYNGISHTNYNLAVARSGRTSSGDNSELKYIKGRAFNMQNIPRDPEIKRIMVARPGHALVAGDLSQIELRTMAAISKDEVLMEAVRDDAHRGMGAVIYDVPYDKVTKEQRNVGKMANFAIIYGVGPEGLANRLSAQTGSVWSFSDAESLISTLSIKFTGMAKWKRFVEWHIKKFGYVSTPLGRRRYFSKKGSKEIREGINCVDGKTLCLTNKGWKSYNNIKYTDLILTVNPTNSKFEWQPPKKISIFPDYEGELVEIKSRSFSGLTNLNHRWLSSYRGRELKIVDTKFLISKQNSDYRILRTGDYCQEDNTEYSDDFLKLIGWVLTDGHLKKSYNKKTYAVCIMQSKRANPQNVIEITSIFKNLKIKPTMRYVEHSKCVYWTFYASLARKIRKIIPKRELTEELIFSLSKRQAVLLVETMVKGDGGAHTKNSNCKTKRFACSSKKKAHLFQMLCVVAGIATNSTYRNMSSYSPKSDKLLNIPKCNGYWVITLLSRTKAHILPNMWNKFYGKELLWCPTTTNGTFVAMREGKVYITGNTPIQACASDFMLIGIININRLLKEKKINAKLVNEIHDQIVGETRISDDTTNDIPNSVLTLGGIVKEGMLDLRWPNSKDNFDWMTVPVKVDIEWSLSSMGEMEKLEV